VVDHFEAKDYMYVEGYVSRQHMHH